MSTVIAAAIVLAIWAAYRIGCGKTSYALYARGWMDGYNAGQSGHVEAQREVAPWQ